MLDLMQLEQEVFDYQTRLQEFAALTKEESRSDIMPEQALVGELIAENSLWQLQSYSNNKTGRPLLVVYALLNSPRILDLSKDCSFLAGLIRAGFDVYLLSWKNDQHVAGVRSYHEYIINQGLSQAVDTVLLHCKQPQLELLGVCQGGVFSLCLSLLQPDKLKRLILMGTPVDLHTADNILMQRAKRSIALKGQLNYVRAKAGKLINSRSINHWLACQQPTRLLMLKYANFIHLEPQQRHEFYQLEQWLWGSGWLSADALNEFIDDFYVNNLLFSGRLLIEEQPLYLASLAVPTLNLYANRDSLVPASASQALGQVVQHERLDYQEYGFNTGHIGLYISDKVQMQVIEKIVMTIEK
ncbi:alpha/beta hydrolase [Piscirickettsia salmonis]|nr:alpha/beta hydrolase [Piscirickettsia salmonis]